MNQKINWSKVSTGLFLVILLMNVWLLWKANALKDEADMLLTEARVALRDADCKTEAPAKDSGPPGRLAGH